MRRPRDRPTTRARGPLRCRSDWRGTRRCADTPSRWDCAARRDADLAMRGLLREREVERASLPFARALHPDAAAVCFDDELAEREAEPRAAGARNVRVLHALELAEDHLVIFRR